MVKVVGISEDEDKSENGGHCSIWKVLIFTVGCCIEKDVNLRVGDGYEMKEGQPNHETDDGIFVDDIYFLDEGLGVGNVIEAEGQLMIRT